MISVLDINLIPVIKGRVIVQVRIHIRQRRHREIDSLPVCAHIDAVGAEIQRCQSLFGRIGGCLPPEVGNAVIVGIVHARLLESHHIGQGRQILRLDGLPDDVRHRLPGSCGNIIQPASRFLFFHRHPRRREKQMMVICKTDIGHMGQILIKPQHYRLIRSFLPEHRHLFFLIGHRGFRRGRRRRLRCRCLFLTGCLCGFLCGCRLCSGSAF